MCIGFNVAYLKINLVLKFKFSHCTYIISLTIKMLIINGIAFNPQGKYPAISTSKKTSEF